MLNYESSLKLIPYFDPGGIKSELSHNINVCDIPYLHIEGNAGMGKTRLVSEIINEIKDKRFIYYYMSPREMLKTKGFVEEILKNLVCKFDIADFLLNVLQNKKLEYEAIFQEVRTYGVPLYNHTSLMIENFICDVLLYLSKTEKVLIVVEDTHWRDEIRDSFLKKMLSHLENEGNTNICVITTSRKPTSYEHLAIAESIQLSSLNFEDSKKLIKSCSIDNLPFSEYAEDLALFSQGNPYFISETLNLLNQRAHLDNLDANLPRSFLDIFKFQLDELNSTEEKIILASSVIGFRVTRKEILFLLPEIAPYIDSALKSLVSKGHLLTIGDDLEIFEFQHILKKENCYSLVDIENRMAWHYALYKYYQSQSIKNIQNKFELCGYHAFQAEAYHEAPRYLWYCGKKALQLSEPQKAVFLFSDFLKCAQETDLLNPNTIVRVNLERCRAFLMQGDVKLAQNSLAGIESAILNLGLSEKDKSKWGEQISVLKVLLLWLDGAFDKKDLLLLRSQFTGDSEANITNNIRLSLMMIDIGEYSEAIDFFENFIDDPALGNNYKSGGLIGSVDMISYSALANGYAGLDDKQNTLCNVQKTLDIVKAQKHAPKRIYGLTFSAKALHAIREYKKAEPLILEAYEISQNYPIGIIKPIVWMEYAIHLTYYKQDYLSALSMLGEYLETTEFKSFGYARMMVKKLEANIYIKMGMNCVALEVLGETERLAKKFKNEHILNEILLSKNKTKKQFV